MHRNISCAVHTGAKKITIRATYTTSGGSKVVVDGSASVPTEFMGIIGYNSITIGGSSTAKWGVSRLRVALVLDNTGSMAEAGKMNALKTATKNLLTQLKNAAVNNGDVYVSIVPFVKDIAVDPANCKQNWIDWTDWDVKNKTCNGRGGGNNDEGEDGDGPVESVCRLTTIPGTAALPTVVIQMLRVRGITTQTLSRLRPGPPRVPTRRHRRK